MVTDYYTGAALGVALVGVVYAVVSLFGSGAAIRAKQRVRTLIIENAASDPELRYLLDQAANNVIMSRSEIEAARVKIAAAVQKLPDQRDRERIRQGISQANSAGVAGYVSDLLREK
jgi:hypothetical protein